MSITIAPTPTPAAYFTVTCLACEATTGRATHTTTSFATFEDADNLHAAISLGLAEHDTCTDPTEHVTLGAYFTTGVSPADEGMPSVNLANLNAIDVLAALGLDGSDGTIDATDMLGRATTALATSDRDAAVPDQTYVTANGIACGVTFGRREGYVHDKLARIVEVSEWARANDRQITWG